MTMYILALLITGFMAFYTWGSYWTILWFWVYGTIYAFSGAFEHECRHRTFFKETFNIKSNVLVAN